MIEKLKIEYVIELLNNLTIKTFNKSPDSIFYLCKDIIYIEYDQKDKHLYIDYNKLWTIFKPDYPINSQRIKDLQKIIIKEYLKLNGGTITNFNEVITSLIEKHLKLKIITTNFISLGLTLKHLEVMDSIIPKVMTNKIGHQTKYYKLSEGNPFEK